ncbi:ESPR-type extended signal peptide-containing protein [Haemophilus haemolyticus]|uniref:ESPR-type extended signal peptide-containing protein n=1 Tax=Haemophilus haemolyticus TaxID=726 RepID=UPI000E58D077|nr:ESPR-type extended signal peptide-containing protein [Haemophilus haemolyticus]
MNKIFRIVWSEVSQAWIAVSELTKSHKKRASATAVAVALVAGVLSPFAEASNTESDPAKNLEPSELGTDYYFRVTTANTGEPDDLEHYNGCRNGNADSACPDTEMNIGVLDKDSAPTEDNSDNSRLVLEGNKGIRLKKAEDKSHKITFDAPVEVADGSGAVSIEQPVTGDKAGHTIIKSEIKSGSPDKIQVTSANGETTITWVGGDTGAAGGAAGGSTSVTAGDGISVSADNKVSVHAKDKGGLTVGTDGVSVKTDGTTIELDTATGNVKAVTGGFKTNATTGATEANDNDGNKLATVTNVANAINDAKVKVTEGNGAKVEHDKATNTYTVSAKVEENKGLENKTEGLSVKAGEGVTVDDKGVSVKSKANGGITVGADGVSVQNGNGITVGADGVSVHAKTDGGLTVDANGVSVVTDGKTINVADGKVSAVTGEIENDAGNAKAKAGDGDKLTTVANVVSAINEAKTKVAAKDGTAEVELADDGKTYKVAAKVASAKGLEKTADGLAIKSKTNGGITVDADGVSVNAKANGGISLDGGVSVDTDNTTIKVDDAGKVSAVTGGFKINAATGVTEANKGDDNKLTTVANVAKAINDAKVKVKAGNGAEVAHDAKTNTYTVSAKVEENKGLENKTEGLSVKAGEGVTVDDKGVSVKSKANGGITVGADGVSVQNGNGITVGADGVSVHAKTDGGLTVDANGVSVVTDGKTINVADGKVSAVTGEIENDAGNAKAKAGDGDKLTTVANVVSAINEAKTKVAAKDGTAEVELADDGKTYKVAAKVASAKGLEKTDDGLAIKSKTNGGLTVDADGVSVNAKANGGLTVDGSGVSVNTDGTTITVDTATGNVKAVTGGFKLNTTTGATEANDNDGNKLATVTNVANAINAAKVKVEAGSGISVAHNAALNTYTVSAPFEKTENDKGTTVTFKGKITTEHPNGETKLTGIAAGDISPTSSDAVNGAQIYGLNRGATTKVENVTIGGNTYNNVIVSNDGKNTPLLKTYNTQDRRTVLTNSVYEAIYNMNEYGIKFFHVNDGTENAKIEGHSENDSSASGKYATAIGALSDASGQNAVAMGFGSKVTGDNSIAIGTGNKVDAAKSGAFGDPNIINGKDVNNVAVSGSYAVGNDNIIDSSNTFVLGNDINNKGNSTPVGHTVENSVYLGNKTTARGGDGSQTAKLKNIKHDGSEGTTTTAGSIGTVNEATVNGVTYGGFAGAKGHGVVSVGAADAERRIQNVAAGEISATSTDAINGSQLYSISSRLGNNMNSLNDRINKVGKRADAGTASAIATANLLQSYRPGLSAATAAVGQYRGQSAIAVGYSRLSDNGKYGVKFSLGANTQGNVGAGAGVAYFW